MYKPYKGVTGNWTFLSNKVDSVKGAWVVTDVRKNLVLHVATPEHKVTEEVLATGKLVAKSLDMMMMLQHVRENYKLSTNDENYIDNLMHQILD